MKYGLEDLVDIPRLQELTDHLYEAAGIPSSIITRDGKILTGSGWQRICTEFHRKHPEIEKECIKSDIAVRKEIGDGEPFCMYTCPRGLTDASAPIVIEGEHIANAFAGQLFLEEPGEGTEEFFREQARHFGMDEEAYVEAFREVPVVPVEKFRASLEFLANLAEMVASQGLQRKQELEAQERLRLSDEKYRTLFENMAHGVFYQRADGSLVDCNPALLEMFGLTRDEFFGRTSMHPQWRVFAEDGSAVPGDQHPSMRALNTGKPVRDSVLRVFNPRRQDDVWLTINAFPQFRPGDDEPYQVFVTLHDITERKKAIDDLRESEERLRAVLDATPFPVAVVDLDDDKIHYWSRSALAVFGHTAPTAAEWYEIAYPDPAYRQEVIERWKPFLKVAREIEKPVNTGEYWVTCADGTERICELWATFIPDRLIVTLNDITERKKAEQELRQFEWLLEKEKPFVDELPRSFAPAYQDPTELNSARVILDGIGREALDAMAGDLLDLLDTSVAIYEANGDYAQGVFESGWCRMMDGAGFKLCGTDDTAEALACGKWLCHENCWNDSARAAMEIGEPTDIECVGGIRLYGVPIRAGDEIIGAVNVGYGAPPRDEERLLELSEKFQVDFHELRANSMDYKPRPPFIIEVAKRSCHSVAKIIGQTIERQRANAALSKTEAQHRTLVETIPDLVWLKDPDGVYLSCNPAFERLYGAREGEIVGRTDYDFVDRETADSFRHHDRKAMEANGPVVNEEWLTFAEGGYHGLFETIKSPMVDNAGQHIGVIGIARDITERNRIRDEIEAIANEQSWLLGSMINAFVIFESVFDEAGDFTSYRFEYINKAYEDITGVRLEEVRGKTVHDVWPGTEDSWIESYGKVATTGDPLTFSMYHGPTEKLYHCRAYRPWETSDRFCVVFEDITEQRKTEEEKDRLEQQLAHSQKMESIGRLAGGVAHDFNNLLTVIINYCDLVASPLAGDDPMRANVDQIRHAADRAADLTRQLLAFSRKQILQPQVIDINESVSKSEKMLQRIIGEDIDLVFVPDPDLLRTRFDPGQAEQILFNLAANARDAMPRGGRLTLRTQNILVDSAEHANHPHTEPGRYVMLAVSDTGMGMDEHTQSRVFDPFFTTKGVGEGTGLGLSTVYGIVKQHGGFVELSSVLGEGTTFMIYLPLVEGSAHAVASQGDAATARGNETILLIEDDPAVREVALQILQDSGFTVLEAADGGEALLLGENHQGPIDLVLTDVVMPGMNGRECVERLTTIRGNLPVLYMSGYSEDTIAHRGVLDEGTRFLQKPFTRKDLVGAVRRALDQLPP